MNYINFFLISALFLAGCSEPEEEVVDLDQMVMCEKDYEESTLWDEPQISPWEVSVSNDYDIE